VPTTEKMKSRSDRVILNTIQEVGIFEFTSERSFLKNQNRLPAISIEQTSKCSGLICRLCLVCQAEYQRQEVNSTTTDATFNHLRLRRVFPVVRNF
jgi:hypothetical protein